MIPLEWLLTFLYIIKTVSTSLLGRLAKIISKVFLRFNIFWLLGFTESMTSPTVNCITPWEFINSLSFRFSLAKGRNNVKCLAYWQIESAWFVIIRCAVLPTAQFVIDKFHLTNSMSLMRLNEEIAATFKTPVSSQHWSFSLACLQLVSFKQPGKWVKESA